MKVPLKQLLDVKSKPIDAAKITEAEKREALKGLSEIAKQITQFRATEQPFHNVYWDHKEEGIYVDVISGKPLFSSKDKFDAGCGWPSFTKPIESEAVSYEADESHSMHRVEVKSQFTEAHLGHVFDDGIEPTGLRYCINSASIKFIPKEQLLELGYGAYLDLFE